MKYTYDEIKKEYEIVYEKEIDRTGITEEQRMFGDMPKRVIVVKIDHLSKYMVYANYHDDEWCVNSGERFVIRELLKERAWNELQKETISDKELEKFYNDSKKNFCSKMQTWGTTLEKSMFHQYTFTLNNFRDNIIFEAITEALPELTELIQACKSGNKVSIVDHFKKNSLLIRIFNNLHKDHFSCESIGCIYQNDVPIFFFDYL